MYSIQCVLYTVYCTVYSVHYLYYIIQCTLWNSTIKNVHCTLFFLCTVLLNWPLYIVYGTVHNAHCTVYSDKCTLYSIQCTLYYEYSCNYERCSVVTLRQLYTAQCTVTIVHCRVATYVHISTYSVHCTLYSVRRTVYTLRVVHR